MPIDPTAIGPRHTIRLPETCRDNRRFFTHCKLLTSVSSDAWNAAGFEGSIYPCGASLDPEDLGTDPIVLEHAGPQGTWSRRKQKRENLWILWRYDWAEREWFEIARATSLGWQWALILRGAAIRALAPQNAMMPDPAVRGREVTDELLVAIDAALVVEVPAVRALVMTSIYDRMAGRIVAAA